MFWLSHHRAEELDRCYRLGSLHVCARCLGTYPVLFAALGWQFAVKAALTSPLDVPAGVVLVVPATLDWAWGRLRNPHAGSNVWRSLTGVLLGLGLGRSLFIHLQHPFPAVLLAQGALVTLVGLPVILTAYLRQRRR